MAATPKYKVYDNYGNYKAACKDVVTAAVLMEFYGDDATIRLGHRKIVWTEGAEDQPAHESYDFVMDVVEERSR